MEPVPMSKAAAGPVPMQVVVVGKIVSARKYQSTYYTVVVCPAADAYSHPAFLEVRSKNRMGDTDEEGKWVLRVGGYKGRQYKFTDKDTGEQRMGQEYNLTLDLVE